MEGRSTAEMGSNNNNNVDKNLEEKIKESGEKLQSPASSAEQLLPLLDEAEALLTRVNQSPSPSMSSAMKPMMSALAAKGMLSHPDADVRVAVAACISEVTRITAPDAPYDDDVMKDLFKRIVESFERMDDLASRSFLKRVSILETVAKVRSCVVMLDLECDDLIWEMFQHFLKTISLKHQENIFSSMETIMSLVIEESEEISKELVSCLLQSVRKDRMDKLSVSFKLGEKVIRNCADKLKPLLIELVGDKTDEYSKFVVSLCQDTSEAMDQSDVEASAKNVPEESKISERTVSDERPQESDKGVEQDPEAEGPEEVVSADQNGEMVEPPPVVDGNGEHVIEEPPSPKQKAERPSRVIKKSTKAKEAEAKTTPQPVKSNKRKSAPAKQTESSGSQEILSDKTEEEAEPKSDEPDTNTPVPESGSRPKRGRAGTAKKAPVGKKEVVEGASDSEGKSLRQSVKKGASASGDTKQKGASASGDTKQKGGPKGQKKEAEGTKSQKKEEEAAPANSDGDGSQDIRVKDIIAAKVNMKKLVKEKANVGESSASKRKRGTDKDKDKDKDGDEEEKNDEKESEVKKEKKHDESIVGQRIKVWWPDDNAFYNGTVQKYSRSDKKHTVAYDDGDVEVLLLKNETWDFAEEDKEETLAPDSSRKKPKTSAVKDIKETPKSSKTGAKSKGKEAVETHKTATSSKKDAESKNSAGKSAPKSKSNGPQEKASSVKSASGAKSGSGTKSRRKGGRN